MAALLKGVKQTAPAWPAAASFSAARKFSSAKRPPRRGGHADLDGVGVEVAEVEQHAAAGSDAGGIGDDREVGGDAGDLGAAAEHAGIADDGEVGGGADVGVGDEPGGEFGADAGGIADGEGEEGFLLLGWPGHGRSPRSGWLHSTTLYSVYKYSVCRMQNFPADPICGNPRLEQTKDTQRGRPDRSRSRRRARKLQAEPAHAARRPGRAAARHDHRGSRCGRGPASTRAGWRRGSGFPARRCGRPSSSWPARG